MGAETKVDLGEVKQVYLLLEDLHKVLHQPKNYEASPKLVEFMQSGIYERLRTAYYDTVWNWLPQEIQEELETRGSTAPPKQISSAGRPDTCDED